MTIIQALDPYMRPISGTLVKTYPEGITIDDVCGVRWYIPNDRIIGPRPPVDDT
jgi:hypothetical protein